jgi:hypothetical protein
MLLVPTPAGIRIIIGLFAALILGIATLTGDSIDENGLRWASGAASAVILLVLAYDRWVWRWPVISRIAEWTNRPVLHGTWKGTLEFERDAAGQPGSIDFYMTIHQTYSTIEVDGHVATSSSRSRSADLQRARRGERLLWFIYQSEAPIPDQSHNQPHYGAAKLTLVGSPVREITGSYWTARGGAGTMRFTEHSRKTHDSFESAAGSTYERRG